MKNDAQNIETEERRLAVVVSHPIQYYAPWFRQIANKTSVTLRVFYLSDHGIAARQDAQFTQNFAWDTDLVSGYDHCFVANHAARPDVTRFSGLHNPDLRQNLRAFNPHAILLFGYAYRSHLDLLIRPLAPIIFRGDSHLLGGPPPHGIKRLILRTLFSRCAAFLPVGTANANYFRHYGVPETKLFPAPHCVDATHFCPTAERQTEAHQLRKSLGIPSAAPVALFAGKLIFKKRPDLLLSAFLRANVTGAHLIFSGNGDLLPELRRRAINRSDVHFLPFANQSVMPVRYLLGDVFVLPSEGRHETWGLAVNEAMHLSRPVIVSSHVGCHQDLLIAGKTGWLFEAGNAASLASVLREALQSPRAVLSQMGLTASRHVAAYNYKTATAGLLAAFASVSKSSA